MSAIISDCGLYRYRLEREVCPAYEGSKVFAFFGVNPSTADATLDDATVRKWRGFTLRNGGHRFIVGNVFSYRATDVRELASVPFQMGVQHFQHLQLIAQEADVLVPCWGASTKLPKHLRGHCDDLAGWLFKFGKPVMHFGLTACGQPKHPLMLGYDTPLTEWAQP